MLSDIVLACALEKASDDIGIVAIGQDPRSWNGSRKQVLWPVSRPSIGLC